MPPPLDPDKRAAIVAAIKGGNTRNAIARMTGVSGPTVTAIAEAEGLTGAFSREATKKATEARQADMAAESMKLAGRWSTFSGRVLGSMERVTDDEWDQVPLMDRARIAGIAVDKAIALQRTGDPESDTSQTLVAELLDGLRARVTTDG